MKKIVIDLDGTLTLEDASRSYDDKPPNMAVIKRLREYREQGFSISIHTARSMRTHEGNVGLINVHSLPIILAWLDKHDVPYDEVVVGKPWCGFEGFYVDDKSIRPSEFASMTHDEITTLLRRENPDGKGGNA